MEETLLDARQHMMLRTLASRDPLLPNTSFFSEFSDYIRSQRKTAGLSISDIDNGRAVQEAVRSFLIAKEDSWLSVLDFGPKKLFEALKSHLE